MNRGVESLGRVKRQGLILLGVVFVVGVLVGGALERIRATRAGPDRPFAERPGPPMRRPGFIPPVLDRLDLSREQRRQIRQVFEKYRPRTDSIMKATFPRLRAVTDSARAEIREILTPEQREILDRQAPNLGDRFRPGMRPRGGDGPPRGPGSDRGI